MPEIDPVILQLRADMLAYQNQMRTTANRVVAQLGEQERAVISLENKMRASSASMAGSLRSLAGAFGAYLSVTQLTAFSDGFTRLQNNLRIAGLEGDALKQVQDRLFASAQRYGVEIEGLSNLYGQLTQASKELGASQSDIFGLTDAVSASLKITGISSQEASGALLQLTQALRGGKVQAEEYNSLLDGLYPLLEAAANGSTKFGGSVSKLTALVKDGKVSSQEFLQAILAGSSVLEGKASQATLTLSAGMTTLNNALTVYFGEADKVNGVSAALGEVFGKIAENLDTIIPALASIAVGLGVRYVAAAGAAAFATGALGSAITALFANPIILGIGALAAGFTYLALRSQEAAKAAGQFAKVQAEAKTATDSAQKAIDKLATAHGKARQEAIAQAKAERDNIKAKLASAQASLILAEAEASRARSKARQELNDAANASPGSAMMVGGGSVSLDRARRASSQADANAKAAERAVIDLNKSLTAINAQLAAPEGAPTASASDDEKKKGRSGPTAEEITARYSNDLRQIVARDLQARLALVTNANDRAELENRMLNDEVRSAADDIRATKEYSDARKKKLLAELAEYEASERRRIDVERQEQNAKDALDISSAERTSARDVLEAQSRLADGRLERRDIELRLLDLAYDQEKAELEAVVASQTASDAQKQIAEARLRVLDQLKGLDQAGVNRDTESPLDRERRAIATEGSNLNDSFEQVAVNGLDRLNDGLADAIVNAKGFGDAFKQVAKQIVADLIRIAIRQTIVNSLMGSIGGLFGGGAPGANVGVGFASGGYTGDGPRNQVAGVVHKGEYVVPARAVDRIGVQSLAALTAGDTSAARAMTGVVAAAPASVQQTGVIRVALMMDNDVFTARVQEASVPVAVEVYKANAPGMVAAAKAETMRDLGRPRI